MSCNIVENHETAKSINAHEYNIVWTLCIPYYRTYNMRNIMVGYDS